MNPALERVTERIRKKSSATRAAYLDRISRAAEAGPARGSLSCSNLAHGMAASGRTDKKILAGNTIPNLAIVTSYNDMLSAHQPFEHYPQQIRDAARELSLIHIWLPTTPY